MLELKSEIFQKEVLESPIPVLVDFWAPWCGPCRMIAPILEQIANEYQDKILVAKVNVDEESELAQKFQIMSIPTMILFKNGQKVDMMIGALPKDIIKSKIEKHI